MTATSITFAPPLLKWFDAHRRDLPWRARLGQAPNPYHVLLSEAMLQQTQVSTVVPYFHRFTGAFPTVHDLARADEQQVLRLWQGLGYYSRARNLLKAALAIVDRFDGVVPRTVDDLLTLPGVGRYTAGAVASIAYDTRAPIVDGNVVRVLCRIDAIEKDPREKAVQLHLWTRAEALLPDRRTGDFNQAMMELGATVCTPKRPSCLICPVQSVCQAHARGIQDRIPPAKPAKALKAERRWVFCLQREDGRYLIEQRPPAGRWAGMWQFISVEATTDMITPADIRHASGYTPAELEPLITVHHTLTHRQYRFDAYRGRVRARRAADADPPRRWASLSEMEGLPFSKPQLAIRQRLGEQE